MPITNRIACILALLLGPWVIAAHAGTANLVRNGSFSQGLEGWSVIRLPGSEPLTSQIDRGVSHTGADGSLRLAVAAGARGLIQQGGLTRTDSTKYVFGLWFRCRDLEPGWVIRVGVVQCVQGAVVRTLQNRHVAHLRNLDWTRIRIPCELPQGAEQLGVYVGLWFPDGSKDPPPGGGQVWFDEISLVPQSATFKPMPAVKLAGVEVEGLFPLGQAPGIFARGESVQMTLMGRNTHTQPVEIAASFQVKDFFDRPAGEKTARLKLDPSAAFRRQVDLPPPGRLGFFSVDAELKIAGATSPIHGSFCVVQPPKHRDPYFVGDVNGLDSELVEAMQRIGVAGRKIGTTMTWAAVSSAEKLDYCRRLVTAGPITPYWNSKLELIGNVYLGLTMPKRFEAPLEERRRRGLFPYPDEYFAEFGDFVEAMARAVKGRVKMWVLSEEIDGTIGIPDLASGSPTAELMRYVLMSRISYERLKKVDPQCVVIGLAVSSDFNRTPSYSLVRQLLPDLRNYTDVIGPDLYTDSWNWCQEPSLGPEVGQMRAKILDTLALHATIGKSRKTAISERGYGVPYHLPPDDPLEKRLAELTARSLIIGKSVPEVLFYSLHVMASGAGWRVRTGVVSTDDEPLLDMGLWKVHYQTDGRKIWYRPRSAVAAYATVARILAGSTGAEEVLPQPDVFCYVFKCPRSAVVAAWTNDSQPRVLQLELPAAAEVVDLMGNPRALPPGTAALRLSGSPLLMESAVAPSRLADALRKASCGRP